MRWKSQYSRRKAGKSNQTSGTDWASHLQTGEVSVEETGKPLQNTSQILQKSLRVCPRNLPSWFGSLKSHLLNLYSCWSERRNEIFSLLDWRDSSTRCAQEQSALPSLRWGVHPPSTGHRTNQTLTPHLYSLTVVPGTFELWHRNSPVHPCNISKWLSLSLFWSYNSHIGEDAQLVLSRLSCVMYPFKRVDIYSCGI